VTSSRLERVLRRGVLIGALVAVAQAVVFAVGWVVVYDRTHEQVSASVEEVIVRSNVAAVDAVVQLLDGLPNVDEFGSPEWERVQRVIEELELGGAGFACVLDSSGYIACHPDIRERPGLRRVKLDDELLADLAGNPVVDLGQVRPGYTSVGRIDLGFDGEHYLATRIDPVTHAQILVHQPTSGLTAASEHVTGPMLTSMIAVGAVLMALTAILALVLVRAHDRTMARWNEQLEEIVAERTAQLIRTHRAIIFGIAKLAEYRDNDTGLHVERMSAYTGAIAREYQRQFGGLEPQWIEDLELAASMHDIGKVAVPDRILLKPGRLSEEEFEEMKVHSAIGEEALIAVREQVDDPHLLDLGIEISGGHHERWDGTGYPRGLAGEKIPLSARIVAVADVFDALMSKRVYKPAMPYEQVVETIRAGRGTHFDPRVVDSFEAVCGVLAVIHSRLQDGPGPRSPLPHAESRHELDPAGA
jgi:HD-GYP domain-containing protein (c-di-GMP phosphodiesterase class II)